MRLVLFVLVFTPLGMSTTPIGAVHGFRDVNSRQSSALDLFTVLENSFLKKSASTNTPTGTSSFKSRSLLSVEDFQSSTTESNHTSNDENEDILTVPGITTVVICLLIVTGGIVLFAFKSHSFRQSQRVGEPDERDLMLPNHDNYN